VDQNLQDFLAKQKELFDAMEQMKEQRKVVSYFDAGVLSVFHR